jgi:tRNA pseudouridine55 synthase
MSLMRDDRPGPEANEDGTRDFEVRVRCSSGTYVRTLAHDLGERLGVGAHLSELRRTEVGHFRLADAVTLDEVETMTADDLRRSLISPSEMLQHFPLLRLDEGRSRLVCNGRAFPVAVEEVGIGRDEGPPIRLCDRQGALVAVGDYDPVTEQIRPRVVMGVEEVDA